MDERPTITCLVGWFCHPFGLIGAPKIVSLEDAADYARFGFTVLVDPATERDLATYERAQRWVRYWEGKRRP